MQKKIHTFENSFANNNDFSFDIRKIEDTVFGDNGSCSDTPHCHDFYYIMFAFEGDGIHFADCIEHKISEPTVFFVTPGQCHSFKPDVFKGYVLSFKLDFLILDQSEVKLYDYPFFHTTLREPKLKLTDKVENLKFVLDAMYDEFKENNYGKTKILRSSLEILLIELTRMYGIEEVETEHISPIDSKRIRTLETLIDQHFIEERKVSFYADKLNITSRHLNNVVKKGIGKSISDMIQERVLVEAKRMLLYSQDTVSEIAWKLNFSDKAYFHRLFKTQTNRTPEGFREKFLKVH